MLVALLVLLGLVNAQGMVLCLEAGGHAQIELSSEGNCSDKIPSKKNHSGTEGPTLEAQFDGTSHCGTCIDIPLGCSESGLQQNCILVGSKKSPKPLVAIAGDASFTHLDNATRHSASGVHGLSRETSLSLRAVVLLV
jgi:hypothetical protein